MDELYLTYLISHDEEIRFWEATDFPFHTLCMFAISLSQILKLNGITTIDEANKYLLETFVPKFNKRFAMDYKKFESVFEGSPSLEKINYTLNVINLTNQ